MLRVTYCIFCKCETGGQPVCRTCNDYKGVVEGWRCPKCSGPMSEDDPCDCEPSEAGHQNSTMFPADVHNKEDQTARPSEDSQ